MYAMIAVKFIDVGFKISLMKRLSNDERIEEVMPLNVKMGFLYRYMNVLIYPISFLFACGYL